jgi:hypothetical protein
MKGKTAKRNLQSGLREKRKYQISRVKANENYTKSERMEKLFFERCRSLNNVLLMEHMYLNFIRS